MVNLTLEQSYPTPYSNSILLPLLLYSLASQKHSPNTSTSFTNEYDYIIVGAGAAGSVVASRLSEIECARVLLLEAGSAPPLINEVPALAPYFQSTHLDWQFKTVPQKHTAKGLNNSQVTWPLGKAIGGCTILNYMLYARGNRKNYDDWQRLGAKGWSYDDVLPYFIKSEDNTDPEYVQNGFHGTGGPITVETNNYESEIKDALIQSAYEYGLQFVDPNGPQQIGLYEYQETVRNKQRCSAAKAYLVPAENRTNLDIVPNAFVKKIVIEKNRAVGVQFDFGNLTYFVRAKKEVIVSAGTVNSAKLLMLSGIGPKKHLKHLKIPVVADLPVGNNLQDHVGVSLVFETDVKFPTAKERLYDPNTLLDYIHGRKGPLANTVFLDLVGFFKDDNNPRHFEYPDYAMYLREANENFLISKTNINHEMRNNKKSNSQDEKSFFLCTIAVLEPFSRGIVRLRSSDPYDPPLIDPNYFADPRDVKTAVKGLKTCLKISTQSEAMIRIGSRSVSHLVSGCEQYINDIDYHLECVARTIITTMYHPVGTAKMGDPLDPTNVVDPQLRVISVDSLRVVDASVMPTLPSGHTYASTVMVAEKAADIIKETIQCDGYAY